MKQTIQAWAAAEPGAPLEPVIFDLGELRAEQAEIEVAHCGICHSDLSMLHNDWGNSVFPLVAGHEAVGTVVAVGDAVQRIKPGDRVGVGWFAGSCRSCACCMSGNHNLCATAEQTIVGRHGAFANRLRANWEWVLPLPDALSMADAGPLFCGGITVFAPLVDFGVRATDRVGVVGIGGLGHLALMFMHKWGCEVTAFTSTAAKQEEALRLGAHHAVDSRDSTAIGRLANSLDFLLITANVPLDWQALLACLAPGGRMHVVGAVLEPIPVPAFALIGGRKSVSGSPLGSPVTTAKMLEFCARHQIAPVVQHYPMSGINDALEHLRSGKARYRIVLDSDFAT